MRLINQIQAFQDGGGLKRPNNITDDQWNKAVELYNSAIKSGDKFPELTLAQAVLETGWFKSPAGRYNYFGQKATKTQQGSTKSTKEVYGGNTVRENAKFRDYNNIDEAMSDRQRLWGSKYQNAETIEEALYSIWNYNPKKQQGEGYATDPKYDTKVKSILENFGISFNAKATERKPLNNTTTPSPTPTLDELNRISPADIWEMYKDEPSKAAELIAFKNEYEERLQKEAQAEKQAEIDLQKQALAQAQAEKQIVKSLLTTPTSSQEDYNTQISQPQQPAQPFRFQTDWYNPQVAQQGGTISPLQRIKQKFQQI